MRVLVLYCMLGYSIPALAYGKDVSVTAVSGQLTKMQDYKSWKDDCTSGTGVVKPSTGHFRRALLIQP
jgi:hypothetical protein